MESIITSLNIVIPIFFIMLAGMVLRKTNILPPDTLQALNRFCTSVLLNILLFYNVYITDFSQALNPALIAFSLTSIVVLYGAGWVVMGKLEPVPERRSVLTLAVARPNYVIFGLILASALCGEEGLGPLTMLIALVSPLLNALCILVLEVTRSGKADIKALVVKTFTNPFLVSVFIGFLTQLLLPFRLPPMILEPIRDMARCAMPLALLALGGLFEFGSLRANRRDLTIGVLARLMIVPAVMLPLSIWAGFRGPDFVALFALYISPVAINTFNMCGSMGSDAELCGQMVVFTSFFSVASMFFWITLLSGLGLF